ncbi:MAG: hypothetical protein LBI27_08550 [Clostridiales bacterium]|jgi:hypothetical protein|nr:hypothetical protein [Clostridiales bacterium]
MRSKIFILAVCVIALIGYSQAALKVHLSFLGITRTFDFGISTIFEEEGPFAQLDLGESDASDILSDSDAVQEITERIIISVASYFAAGVMLIVTIIFSLLKKSRGVFEIIFSLLAIILHIVSSRVIQTVPELVAAELADILANRLGFFARFINPNILRIELGNGYWITLFAILLLFLHGLLRIATRMNTDFLARGIFMRKSIFLMLLVVVFGLSACYADEGAIADSDDVIISEEPPIEEEPPFEEEEPPVEEEPPFEEEEPPIEEEEPPIEEEEPPIEEESPFEEEEPPIEEEEPPIEEEEPPIEEEELPEVFTVQSQMADFIHINAAELVRNPSELSTPPEYFFYYPTIGDLNGDGTDDFAIVFYERDYLRIPEDPDVGAGHLFIVLGYPNGGFEIAYHSDRVIANGSEWMRGGRSFWGLEIGNSVMTVTHISGDDNSIYHHVESYAIIDGDLVLLREETTGRLL